MPKVDKFKNNQKLEQSSGPIPPRAEDEHTAKDETPIPDINQIAEFLTLLIGTGWKTLQQYFSVH